MDQRSGLAYMQQRYYDPGIGRFLSVDPMASDMNNAWNFNRYNYAANNPYRYTDPDGRVANVLVGAGIGIALDLVIQGVEIAAGSRDSIDRQSLVVSGLTGAVGVGIAGKLGKLGELVLDATISAVSTAAKGNEVTASGVVLDVVAGNLGKKVGADQIRNSAKHKLEARRANRLERIGNKPGARAAQQDRAASAGPKLNQAVQQEAAAKAGTISSNVGSALGEAVSAPDSSEND